MCGYLSHAPYWGPGPHNPGMCPDWELNWRPFESQPVLSPLSHISQGSYLFLLKFLFSLLTLSCPESPVIYLVGKSQWWGWILRAEFVI